MLGSKLTDLDSLMGHLGSRSRTHGDCCRGAGAEKCSSYRCGLHIGVGLGWNLGVSRWDEFLSGRVIR